MLVVFFLVVTPIGLFMRMLGKDILNLKFNEKINTYWIEKKQKFTSMRKQY